MNISVIICSWNNAKLLHRTLSRLGKVTIPPHILWELILVDNNSTDSTAQVAKEFESKLPLKYFFEARQGLALARNLGIEKSSGELIIFTDDDVLIPPHWIEIYWRAYLKNPERVYGGAVESEFEGEAPPTILDRYVPWSVKGLNHGSTDRLLKENEQFLAANWSVARSNLKKVGGFNEKLGLKGDAAISVGEESELQRKLRRAGHPLFYLAEARIQHFVPVYKCSLTHLVKRAEAGSFDFQRVLLQRSTWLKKIFHIVLVPHLLAWRYVMFKISEIFKTSKRDLRYIKLVSACGLFRAVHEFLRGDLVKPD